MRKFPISVGKGVLPEVQYKEVTWEQLVTRLTTHKKLDKREAGPHFIGGTFKWEYRNDENLEVRSLLTIDVDEYTQGGYEDVEFQTALIPYTVVAYSTYRSTGESPRFRLVFPLSRHVTGDEYRIVSKAFADTLDFKVDAASFKPAQFMFLPSSPTGEGWSYTHTVEDIDVEQYLGKQTDSVVTEKSDEIRENDERSGKDSVLFDDDGLDLALAYQPLDLSDQDIDAFLDAYEAEGLDYDAWAEVGLALAHQYQQSEAGFSKWLAWSEKSTKHNSNQMRIKWRSFRGSKKPVTFATIIHRLKTLNIAYETKTINGEETETKSPYERLVEKAQEIDCIERWNLYKARLQATPEAMIGKDLRELLAHEVYLNWGKTSGMSKRTIIKALTRVRKGQLVEGDIYRDELPETKDGVVLKHISNLEEILKRLGVIVRYNVITKTEELLIPDTSFTVDNKDNASRAWLVSECSKFGFSTDKIDEFLSFIADQNQYNPVATWIDSKDWDGISRLEDLYATIQCQSAEQEALKKVLIKRWMISAIAGAYSHDGVAAGGVLVFQGEQYIGKTYWFKKLVPEELGLTKEGLMLRPDNKDSVIQACSYWIAELGEIDSTFRRSDISALKAFITAKQDVVRRPYARKDSHYARRTVFFGSVNPKDFLHDDTGNRRYWTIECASINHGHDLDMQQVWSEVKELWLSGESHFLNQSELQLLNKHNENFMAPSAIMEKLGSRFAWEAPIERWRWLTATDILGELDYRDPTKSHLTKCGIELKKMKEFHPQYDVRNSNRGTLHFVPPMGSTLFD